MNSWRTAELRQVLHFVREAQQSLREGDLVHAFRRYELALRGLSLARGRACRPGGNVTATATLLSLVADLGLRMEMALQPSPRVEAWELVAPIADGLKILQTRDGVDVSDAQIFDRARNIAAGLTERWEFVAVNADQCPENPLSGATEMAPGRGRPS